MDLISVIRSRRAFRSLASAAIDSGLIQSLAESASLAPSCFNKQPWRYIFAYGADALMQVKTALNAPGNDWAQKASLIIAVACRKEDDCIVKDREYYLFDTGMATAHMILRGTELGLIMHPIAGYDELKVKQALGIPDDQRVITLIVVGKRSDTIDATLSEGQKKSEVERPVRMPLSEFARIDRW